MKTNSAQKQPTRHDAPPASPPQNHATQPGQAPRAPAAPPPAPVGHDNAMGQILQFAEQIPDLVGAVQEARQESQQAHAAVGTLTTRIEAVERRASRLPEQHSIDERLEQLATGAQFAEIADRIDHLEARGLRVQEGSNSPEVASAFHSAVANSPELRAWIEEQMPDRRVQFSVPRTPRHRHAATVLDSDYLAELSQDHIRSGVITLLQDPVGLVDVVNEVPAINADTYKFLRWSAKSQSGILATTVSVAVDGDPTPKSEIEVTSTIGFFAGQVIAVFTASGVHQLTILTVDAVNSKFTFTADTVDFDAAVGDDITAAEYLATGEGLEAPGGLFEAELDSVDLQALPSYVVLTRQRLLNSNQIDLASQVERELPGRLRYVKEYHLLYGTGTGGQLVGFLNHSIIASQTDLWSGLSVGDTRADLVLKSAATIPGESAVVACLHKNDWWNITNSKATDGHYIYGDSGAVRIINTPGLKAIGNVRVVLSRKVAQSTGLVLAPVPAHDFVPGPKAQMVWAFTGNQLIEGKVTAYLYEQWANAIKDTQAFRKISFDSAPS